VWFRARQKSAFFPKPLTASRQYGADLIGVFKGEHFFVYHKGVAQSAGPWLPMHWCFPVFLIR
jgi:hypothetical protein